MNKSILEIILAICIYYIISIIIHFAVFKGVTKEKNIFKNIFKNIKENFPCEGNETHKNDFILVKINKKIKFIIRLIIEVFLPDRMITATFKKSIKNHDKIYSDYLEGMNIVNLYIGILTYGIITIFNFTVPDIIIVLLVIRGLSRAYEVAYAFFKDVVGKDKKKSQLNSKTRIQLGLNSFLEIIINYAIIYFVAINSNNEIIKFCIGNLSSDVGRIKCIIDSIGVSTLTNVNGLSIIKITQLVSSMSLIYFALAGYLSDSHGKPELIEEINSEEVVKSEEKSEIHSINSSYKIKLVIYTVVAILMALVFTLSINTDWTNIVTKNEVIYYFAGATWIAVIVFLGEIIIELIVRKKNNINYKDILCSMLKNSIYIIVAFVFVGIANNKISNLTDVNKRERAIWSIYEPTVNALEDMENIFEISNSDIKNKISDIHKEIEKSKCKEDNKNIRINKDLSSFISRKLSNNPTEDIIITDNNLELKGNIKADYIRIIDSLKADINNVMDIYITYINDVEYKNIAQLSDELSRYRDKFNQGDSIKLPIKYISNLFYLLNITDDSWYDLYEDEVKTYNNLYKHEEKYKIKDNSLKTERVMNNLLIEELCYEINLSDIKNEVIYRLIEEGKIQPTKAHAESIIENIYDLSRGEADKEMESVEDKFHRIFEVVTKD